MARGERDTDRLDELRTLREVCRSMNPKLCTTSGEPVDQVRAAQTEATGQHKAYIVLCEEERRKGFVRPYRDIYRHVGRSVCAKIVDSAGVLGGPRRICDLPEGHEGACDESYRTVTQPEHAELLRTHRLGGCGTITTMGRDLSETYARDPTFYGETFCVACNKHLPVAEFVWDADGQQVGS